ncbi:hypothetical protein DFH11DRAFT_1543023 [Phellopilus nigrolimitatus]|nr:hypothetical protein DFH11DRAFT_1543023 [Phellopilus nigrolimitatus]
MASHPLSTPAHQATAEVHAESAALRKTLDEGMLSSGTLGVPLKAQNADSMDPQIRALETGADWSALTHALGAQSASGPETWKRGGSYEIEPEARVCMKRARIGTTEDEDDAADAVGMNMPFEAGWGVHTPVALSATREVSEISRGTNEGRSPTIKVKSAPRAQVLQRSRAGTLKKNVSAGGGANSVIGVGRKKLNRQRARYPDANEDHYKDGKAWTWSVFPNQLAIRHEVRRGRWWRDCGRCGYWKSGGGKFRKDKEEGARGGKLKVGCEEYFVRKTDRIGEIHSRYTKYDKESGSVSSTLSCFVACISSVINLRGVTLNITTGDYRRQARDHLDVVRPEFYVAIMIFVNKDSLEPRALSCCAARYRRSSTRSTRHRWRATLTSAPRPADPGDKGSGRAPAHTPGAVRGDGIQPPKIVFLYGVPGTGKTFLTKAVANWTSATFLRVVGSELIQKYLGDGQKLVRELFRVAEELAPSIVSSTRLILPARNGEQIARSRLHACYCMLKQLVQLQSTSGGEREIQRTMLELLNGLDGFDTGGDLKVIMATNVIESLDLALTRPGRIGRKVEFIRKNPPVRLVSTPSNGFNSVQISEGSEGSENFQN